MGRQERGGAAAAAAAADRRDVNSPRADRGTLFQSSGSDGGGGWRNRLIWGETLHVLASLADEMAGQFDLVYIDPGCTAARRLPR